MLSFQSVQARSNTSTSVYVQPMQVIMATRRQRLVQP